MVMMQADDKLNAPTAVIAGYLRRTISVSYLIGLAWTGKLIVATGAILGFLWGVYAVHAAGPSYSASMRISPATSESNLGNLSGAGGLLAGLSSGIESTEVPKFTQFTYALGSVEVAEALDQRYGLLCRIYRGDCDPVTHQWRTRTGVREMVTSLTARLSGLPDPNVGPQPVANLASYITKRVVTVQLKKSDSVFALTFVNRDPAFAAQFLSQVVKTTNDYVRTQSRATQKRYVQYLSESAAKATNVEQRQAIDTLLLQEERQLMMTEVDIPYAAKILDGPTVIPVYDALKRITIYTALGLFLGLAISMSRDLLPRRWRVW